MIPEKYTADGKSFIDSGDEAVFTSDFSWSWSVIGLERHARETYALMRNPYPEKKKGPQGAMKQKLTVPVDAGLKMDEAAAVTAGRVHSHRKSMTSAPPRLVLRYGILRPYPFSSSMGLRS